jgi:hypothetical protein
MVDESDYLNSHYIGSAYGDMRRERKALMCRMIFENDGSVKPRIREITIAMQEYTKSGRFSATNPPINNHPKTVRNK